MRELGTVVSALMAMSGVKYFFLVSIRGTDHSTSLSHDITMSNNVTYLADNGLIGVEPPRLSTTVDREAYKISFSDPNFTMKSYFEDGAVGDTVEVRLGFVNPTQNPITGSDAVDVLPQMPFLDLRDTIITYRGTIDNHGYGIDFAENAVTATIEGSSPMSDLDLVRTFQTSKECLQQFAPTDTAFDQVFVGSQEIIIKWGKQ